MIENLRTAVIGVGSMGRNHVRVYSEISNLVGVVDKNKIIASEIAQNFNTNFYTNYEDIVDKVDAVSIAVPTKYHFEVAEFFIKKGIHVLIEKPLADNSENAQKIVNLAHKYGVILGVGHIERHNPVVAFSKKAISENKWGEIITMSSRRVSFNPGRITDVGVVFDLSSHDIDVMNYLSGSRVKEVFASGGSYQSENCEDYINAHFKFENGLEAFCESNWLTPMKVRKLELTTSSEFIELDYMNQSIKLSSSSIIEMDSENLYETKYEFKETDIPIVKSEPLKLELVDFLASISKNRMPLVTGDDGLQVIKVAESMLQSMESGNIIKLK